VTVTTACGVAGLPQGRSPGPAARRICFNPSRCGSTALPFSLQTLPSLPQQRHPRFPPPMPLTLPFRAVFAVFAVALSCCACLLALLKSVLRAECPAPGGSSHHPVIAVCVGAAALCLVASAAHLVKSRAWTQAAALCSKWQPVYFMIVLVQRLVLTAIVAYAVVTSSGRAGSCSLESEYENAVHAVSLMWSCAVLMAALSAMCGDTEAQLPPTLRRCAYGVLALVLFLDAIGSVVWGNPLAGDASFSVTESFGILLDNQLTSSIASQAVLALHFVYVSCRSRRGRGWAYASLRFELDECGRSMLKSMPMVATMTGSGVESGASASAATLVLASDASARAELQPAGAGRWKALSRLRQRWLQFQQLQVSRCRVFVVPCVAMRGAGGGGEAVFALARPAFDLRLVRPLQRLADAHPRLYIGVMFFFVAVPDFVCTIVFNEQSQARGISTSVLTFMLCIMMVGFLSSKRYGLDRVAVKHVALSFRYAIFVTLLAVDVALTTREVYTVDSHPLIAVAVAFTSLFFCLCVLFDCSPHLPPWVQIFISVNACNVAYQC
jgi:hypothetical protein